MQCKANSGCVNQVKSYLLVLLANFTELYSKITFYTMSSFNFFSYDLPQDCKSFQLSKEKIGTVHHAQLVFLCMHSYVKAFEFMIIMMIIMFSVC